MPLSDRRTPAEAAQILLDRVQQVVSCVTGEVPSNAGGYYARPEPHLISFANAPVRLRGPLGFSLVLLHGYRIMPASRGQTATRRAETAFYYYALRLQDGPEALGYHWHPETPLPADPVATPHLHLGAGLDIMRKPFIGAHLPTGLVTLEQLVDFAITDLGVEPLRDCSSLLRRGQARGADEVWLADFLPEPA